MMLILILFEYWTILFIKIMQNRTVNIVIVNYIPFLADFFKEIYFDLKY